jgi:G:T-mismatch repair DNA endonuclease (very short patch repair protein)
MLEEKRFNRAPESNRALIAAGLSIQIMVTLGLKFLAQTASLTWSPDHVLVNFEVGLTPCNCFVGTHNLALFLVEWLCSMESPDSEGGSDEEKKVYNLLS